MTASGTCPICGDPLGASAVTVTVSGTEHRLCCDACAREAAANPSGLTAP